MGRRKQKSVTRSGKKKGRRARSGKVVGKREQKRGAVSYEKIRRKPINAVFFDKTKKRNLKQTIEFLANSIDYKRLSKTAKGSVYAKVSVVGKYRKYVGRTFALSGKTTPEGIKQGLEKIIRKIFSTPMGDSDRRLPKWQRVWKNYLTGLKFEFE